LNFNLKGGEFVKKLLGVILVAMTVLSTAFSATKGGINPLLATCCIGPRVGLEMNEGTKIRDIEWIGFIGGLVFSPLRLAYTIDPVTGKTMDEVRAKENLGGNPIYAKEPKQKGGFVPFLGACCLGPRVGLELNDGRKVRNMEYLALVPVVQVVPMVLMAVEAYQGKTMAQVAAAEGLDR
jgi:hypothetical protein